MLSGAWPEGRIRIREIHGVRVIEFHGEVDIATAIGIEPELDAATLDRDRIVIIDLSPVAFFDIYALRLLCRTEERVRTRGGRLLLVCPQKTTLRLLRAGHLMGRFAPVATLEEALDAGGRLEAS
ncbi:MULTISPECIES: STAS domain-containing protein [Streptomyces]|uniref:STAS domain-containing protein n=1 Tax=Streptomyces TaxID=1883 RepID=UPI00210DE2ED|nr:STAS domain-containing protein [Streptomyces longispororuber]